MSRNFGIFVTMLKPIFLLGAIVLGVLLGWTVTLTPAPQERDAQFSAYRMYDHLQTIAAEERSVFHPERRMYVRDYIIRTMEGFGLTPVIDDFVIQWEDYAGRTVPLYGSNVFFTIPGRSDTAIMLMAHYDSRGVNWTLHPDTNVHSPGAADAGYGIVTMFEIARYFSTRTDLENSIKFFFTDLEEIWMLGAVHASETMDFSHVNMILNLEARGIRGPIYMFETNANDFNVVRFFRNATNHRHSYSLATAIFRMMQNDTDLSPFIDLGFAGMNFAPLDSLMYYHTADDSLEHVNLRTLQKYALMIADIVEYYATDSRFSDVNYFVTDRSGVYFTLPFGGLALYNDIVAIVLAIITFVIAVGLCVYLLFLGYISLDNVLRWAGFNLIALAVAAVIGTGVGFIVSLVTGQPFYLTYVPLRGEMFIMWPMVTGTLAAFAIIHFIKAERYNKHEMAISGILLLAVIQLALAFIMVQATFLVLVPLVLAVAFYSLSNLNIAQENNALSALFAALPLAIMGFILVPVMIAFTLALTVGALGILMALAIFILMPFPSLWVDDSY